MSQENLEVIKQAIAAINERDVDRYLACCTDDIELRTPLAGVEGAHEGPDGIRRYFSDLEDAGREFWIDLEHLEPVGENRAVAFVRAHASGRTSGVTMQLELTNVYDLAKGKLRRVRIYSDRDQALEAVRLPE
jgi:ketosteroid isomerase-like protein